MLTITSSHQIVLSISAIFNGSVRFWKVVMQRRTRDGTFWCLECRQNTKAMALGPRWLNGALNEHKKRVLYVYLNRVRWHKAYMSVKGFRRLDCSRLQKVSQAIRWSGDQSDRSALRFLAILPFFFVFYITILFYMLFIQKLILYSFYYQLFINIFYLISTSYSVYIWY